MRKMPAKSFATPFLNSKPTPKWPLIELCGDLDCGKTVVGEAIARKLGTQFYKFPVLDATKSLTGLALLTLLGQNPQALENNPWWWAHMYIANMHENQYKILDMQAHGPVIVSNWRTAARTYLGATVQCTGGERALYRGLAVPDLVITLLGQPWDVPGNFYVDFSPRLKRTLHSSFLTQSCTRFISVVVDEKNTTRGINEVAQKITNIILRKFPHVKQQKDFKYAPGTI
jgi:hypothetical protein